MTLTEFLLARVADDEALAERSVQLGDKGAALISFGKPDAAPVLIVHPERFLAECEAKRQVVAIAVAEWDPETIDRAIRLNQRGTTMLDEDGQPEVVAEWTTTRLLRALAAVYADHPDYQPEWKPTLPLGLPS